MLCVSVALSEGKILDVNPSLRKKNIKEDSPNAFICFHAVNLLPSATSEWFKCLTFNIKR